MAEVLFTIRMDASALVAQLDQLQSALDGLSGSALEAATDKVVEDLQRLRLNLVLGDGVATPGADGVLQIVRPIRIGGGFDDLLSALRAGEVDEA